VAQEAKEKAEALQESQEVERKQIALERKRSALDAQIKVLQSDLMAEEMELEKLLKQQQHRNQQMTQQRAEMNRIRLGSPDSKSNSEITKAAGGSK
jgi:hypothetical protein